jgi:hypothetical protein
MLDQRLGERRGRAETSAALSPAVHLKEERAVDEQMEENERKEKEKEGGGRGGGVAKTTPLHTRLS